MKKLLLSVCMIAASSLSAFSQTEYSGSYDIYGLDQKPQIKKVTFSIEAGLGNEIQAGLRAHLNFNKYLTWDMLGVQYAYDMWGDDEQVLERTENNSHKFSNDDKATFDPYNEIAITTGIRGFLPLGRSAKLFAALNLGYGHVWANEEYTRESREWIPGRYNNGYYTSGHYETRTKTTEGEDAYASFLLDTSVGISFTKNISLSYSLQFVTGDYSHLDHVARLAVTF